jgi:hypothetical protein
MRITNSQQKGNAAEYLICYELQKQGIPVWQLGGNNKRWDIVFQVGEDEFIPAQVKARTQSTLSFKREDLNKSKGYYFIWFTPGYSRHKNSARLAKQLSRLTEVHLGKSAESAMLIYTSESILDMLLKGEGRASNEGSNSLITNLTEADITEGLKGYINFFDSYGSRSLGLVSPMHFAE